jgi:hypothetical protein
MTVEELMEQLEQMPPDAEVRLAIQPAWPLTKLVGDVVVGEDGKVWIAEGGDLRWDENPYVPGDVTAELGWSKEE